MLKLISKTQFDLVIDIPNQFYLRENCREDDGAEVILSEMEKVYPFKWDIDGEGDGPQSGGGLDQGGE